MKRIFWTAPLLVTTSLFAQPSGVTVSLEVTPPSVQTVNNEVILKATVSAPGVATQPLGGGGVGYDRDRLRFTFTLQRSWPCPKTITLGDVRATSGESTPLRTTHVATYPWSWNPINAGEYTFSVDVTYLGAARALSPQGVTLKPQRVGSATIAKYTVKPVAGWSGNVGTNFSPPSESTAPVSSLYLYVTLNNQPSGTWYRYQYWCTSGCQPGTAMKNNQPTSTSFQLAIPNPGSYRFDIGVDRVYQSNCLWDATIVTHSSPYYYVVKPLPPDPTTPFGWLHPITTQNTTEPVGTKIGSAEDTIAGNTVKAIVSDANVKVRSNNTACYQCHSTGYATKSTFCGVVPNFVNNQGTHAADTVLKNLFNNWKGRNCPD